MTLKKRIIPCLDVDHGRVVKGVAFSDLRDAGDPAELALRYETQGADEIVFLDISATHEDRAILLDTVRRTAHDLSIPLCVGGGLRTVDDIRAVLRAGADKAALNSAAVSRPEFLREAADEFGCQCIVLAVDAGRDAAGQLRVFTRGGREATELDPVAWVKQGAALGAGEILLTVIDRDGAQRGYDLELTEAVAQAVQIPVIASGGAGTVPHFTELFNLTGADAALLASTLHRGQLTIPDIKIALHQRGIPVRMTP
jgi:cyclase